MKNIKTLVLFLIIILITAQLQGQDFDGVDKVITSGIETKIFPGAAIAVGTKDSIIFQMAYGHYTYESTSPLVSVNSMFDLASVTKAFGTNFCVMKLVDENKLDIYKKVSDYIPDFGQHGKNNIRVVDLLIHESGLQAYYTPAEDQSRNSILDSIYSLNLAYNTGEKTLYSCLNFVTTMQVVEAVSSERLYKFYKENFTDPLGMNSTMFCPPSNLKTNCIPTTPELQGVVHDPLARGLEGLSGNAGLFSTVGDLSKLCMILLNDGNYKGKNYLSRNTIDTFKKRYSANTERALGFDTRSSEGYASSGQYFSEGSFGHLGYTGTSVWIDPVKGIFVVFFTNRVYPDDSAGVSEIRPLVYDAVMQALGLDK